MTQRRNRRRRILLALQVGGIAVVAGLMGPSSASSLPGFNPTARISASPNPALVNQTVTFNGSTSTGDGFGSTVANYKWDLDGSPGFEVDTGTTPTTSRSYASPATVTARLRVTDNEGDTDEDTVSLKVHSPPVASFTFTPAVPLPNETITFDGSASNDPDGPIAPADHDWDLDNDGAFDDAEGKIITHSYADSGQHTVRLQVTDSDGAVAVESTVVRVNAPPTAGFDFDPTTPGVNEVVNFSSTAFDPEGTPTQRWDFDGDGFDDAVGANVNHSFASAGTKTVRLEVTDSDGVIAIASREVLVQANHPTATFTFAPGTPLSNETVNFDGSASTAPGAETITATNWDLDGDGQFDDASGPTASYSYPTSGPRTVGLRVDSSGGGFDITTRVVPVGNRAPTASFNFAPNEPRAGNKVELTSTSSDPDGPIVDQAWDLDDDGEYDDASGPNVQTTFPTAGIFTVGLKVRDSSGISEEVRRPIDVRVNELDLLSPFPIIRLTGELMRNGKTLVQRLSIKGPPGTDVAVRCNGKSCPFDERERAVKFVRVNFPGFKRPLKPGVVLKVYATEPDKIGKFTRFKLRDGKAPKRTDSCLEGDQPKPIHCPD